MLILSGNEGEKLINSLRESFLVHSYLYYHTGQECIPDSLFDARARHLARLQDQFPNVSKRCIYQDYFETFNPATGMDIPVDDWIKEKAQERLDQYSKFVKKVK